MTPSNGAVTATSWPLVLTTSMPSASSDSSEPAAQPVAMSADQVVEGGALGLPAGQPDDLSAAVVR